MPSTAIGCGLALIMVGIAGYVWGIMDNNKASITALIPALFGLVIAIFGALAQSKESLRKHMMHAALLVALIGFIIPTARLLMDVSKISLTPSVIAQAAMALLCLLFVVIGLQSFFNARRSREV
jgi:small-conductance mechanosensitive channel